jgi:hypothetical protein
LKNELYVGGIHIKVVFVKFWSVLLIQKIGNIFYLVIQKNCVKTCLHGDLALPPNESCSHRGVATWWSLDGGCYMVVTRRGLPYGGLRRPLEMTWWSSNDSGGHSGAATW